MFLLQKIKNKRGDALILSFVIIFVFVLFMAFLVDIGMGYTNRAQIQSIADAAAIGGANIAKQAHYSVADGKKFASVDPVKANAMANSLVLANSQYLMSRASLSSPTFNPSNKKINGKVLSTKDQYYAGSFTVTLKGAYQTFFMGTDFANSGVTFPFLRYGAEARVQVTPE